MARTPSILYQGLLSSSTTTHYTVPTSIKTTITCIECSNVNSATQTFSLYCVPYGSTAADSYILGQKLNKLVGTDDSDGGGYWAREIPTPLTNGYTIRGIATADVTIAVKIIGFTEPI